MFNLISRVLFLSLVLLIVAGCEGADEDTGPLPTLEFNAVQPSLTPSPEVPTATIDPLASPAPTATPRGPRPLPPTFTPTPIPPTFTLVPTLDLTGTAAVASPVPAATLPAGCATFNLDMANSVEQIRLGQSPTLAWTAAGGAALYRVYVYNEQGIEVHEAVVDTTSVTVDPNVFTIAGVYPWTVAPLDSLGIQFCVELGSGVVVDDR